MAFIPNSGALPGVYGPISYPVKKLGEDNYYIRGYSKDEFTGSIKQISRKLLQKLIHEPERPPRRHYVGPFAFSFWPDMKVGLCMDPAPDPHDLDIRALNRAFEEELKPHFTMTVENDVVVPHITLDGQTHTLVPCDTPLLIDIMRDSVVVLKTDSNGLTFKITGDKYSAGIAFLEQSVEEFNTFRSIISDQTWYRRGAILFHREDGRFTKAEPFFQEHIPNVPFTPENRPEVFEIIDVINSCLKMKAFL